MSKSYVKFVNDIGSWIVVKKTTNEGLDFDDNETDDSFDYFVEIGHLCNGKFEAEAHHYFVNRNEFKNWINDLYNTFVKE